MNSDESDIVGFFGYGADYGKCPSKKETYFGYKVHAMITLEGYITTFEITPAFRMFHETCELGKIKQLIF